MFVGHFAAALALRGRAPAVPVAAWICGAFALDGLWIAFGVSGLDPTPWSDWSHSLLMALVWSTVFAALFARYGGRAVAALWLVAFSHYPLDFLIQGATLFPGSPVISAPVTTQAWGVQRLLSAGLMLVFLADERRAGASGWRSAGACAVVITASLR